MSQRVTVALGHCKHLLVYKLTAEISELRFAYIHYMTCPTALVDDTPNESCPDLLNFLAKYCKYQLHDKSLPKENGMQAVVLW